MTSLKGWPRLYLGILALHVLVFAGWPSAAKSDPLQLEHKKI
jgi:hypothetical protein